MLREKESSWWKPVKHCSMHGFSLDSEYLLLAGKEDPQNFEQSPGNARVSVRLSVTVTPAIMFRELAEKPWVQRWGSQVLGFMHRLFVMPQSSVQVDILRENISAAQRQPICGIRVAGIVKQNARLGLSWAIDFIVDTTIVS